MACLIGVLAAMAFATPAIAARNTKLFGVNATSLPTAGDFQRATRAGGQTVRMTFYWPSIELSPGAYNWRDVDPVVANAARAGAELLPVLYGTPGWATPRGAEPPTRPPIYTPQSRAAWSSFVAALALRYGNRGSFWTAHPEVPRIPIRNWQIWNEVNLPYFWGGRPNVHGYARLVIRARMALNSVDPSARLILAGLLPYQGAAKGSVAGTNFLKQLYRVKGIRKAVDAVAVHPYAARPAQVIGFLRDIRRVINSVGARKTPIWATEFGWTTGGTDFATSPFRTSLDQQAHRVFKTYRLMRRNARRLRLRRALYYSFNDFDPQHSGSWLTRMGLFDLNGQPKPAWFAYARAAGGQP